MREAGQRPLVGKMKRNRFQIAPLCRLGALYQAASGKEEVTRGNLFFLSLQQHWREKVAAAVWVVFPLALSKSEENQSPQ